MKASICLFVVVLTLYLCDWSLAADPLDTWTVRNPLPTPNDLRAVTTGNGLVVAVGTAGTIVTSADSGDTWTVQDSVPTAPTVHFLAVAYGNGKFVALPEYGSQQPIITSLNGTNWTTNSTFFAPVPTAFTSITFGGGTFVAVGYSGDTNLVYTSPDGVAWTRRSAGVSNSVNAVTFAQNQFVAVGGTAFPTNRGFIITSPDGVTWTTRRSNVPALYAAVAGNATGFVAVGGRMTSRSANGTTWTDITDVGVGYAARNAVAASGILFIAADTTRGTFDSSTLNSSTDGAAWTANGTMESISALTFANGRFFAVGSANSPGYSPLGTRPALLFSDDGLSWKRRAGGLKQGFNGTKAAAIKAVAFGNGRFIALPTNSIGFATAFSSTNGADWGGSAFANSVSAAVDGVIFTNGQFIAVGGIASAGNTTITTSSDGTNWTQRYNGSRGPLSSVAFGNSLYVAVGRRSLGERPVLTSSDGTNWNVQIAGITNDLFGIAFGSGNFVAVGTAGTVARSVDGSSWTTQSITSSNHLHSVVFAGGQFVAVGDWGGIFTSPNGTAWTRRPSGTTLDLQLVTYFNGRYLAGGDAGKLLTSLDGNAWSAVDSGTDFAILGAATGADRLLLVGESSLLATSTNGLSWTGRDLSVPGDALFREVIGVDDRVLALGSGQAISATGRGWAGIQNGGLVAGNGAVYANGLVVAVGTDELGQATKISLSTDRGDSWSTTNLGSLGQLYGIVYATGKFVAVGDRPGGTNAVILTSTNGYNWTYRNSGFPAGLWDVAYGNGLFVAVGSSGGVRSTDGVTWTTNAGAKGETVAFGAGKFVAAGSGAVVSSDGINWSPTDLSASVQVENVRHGQGNFVAVGPSGIYTSANGINWTNRFVRTLQKLNAVEFANDSFFVVGFSGTIYQSDYLTNTPASIVQGPQNLTVLAGAPARLTANVTGRLPLSFQWFKNGVPIPGATELTLSLPAVTAADSGSYRLAISNESGSQTSSPATLTVTTVTATVTPEPLYLFLNTSGGLTVSVTGTTPTAYQWRKNFSPIPGATNATLNFSSAQPDDFAQYSVVVTTPFGPVTSTNAPYLYVLETLDQVYLNADPSYLQLPIGSSGSITSSVSGPSPLTYQWRKDGTNVVGATNSVLVITNAQLTNSGDYGLKITFPQGVVTNEPLATVVVYYAEPPVITGSGLTAPGLMQITFTGLIDRYYQLDYATNLTPPVAWQFLDSVQILSNPRSYSLPIPILYAPTNAFIRIQILPP